MPSHSDSANDFQKDWDLRPVLGFPYNTKKNINCVSSAVQARSFCERLLNINYFSSIAVRGRNVI